MIDLFQTGAYLRVPGGNVERPDIQMPVISWAALNIGGDVGRDPTVWANQQRIYKAAGLPFGPWLHCRNLGDIDFLIDVGQGWGSPFIGLNIEDIQGDFVDHGISLQDIAQKVAGWPGPVHMATLPWVQNGQGWKVMSRCVAALEIFPDEQHSVFPNGYDPAVVNQCIGHAFEEGLTQVTLMFKTKGWTQTAYGAPFSICHSLYTADDITPTAPAWQAWRLNGDCTKPKPPAPPVPPPVTTPQTRAEIVKSATTWEDEYGVQRRARVTISRRINQVQNTDRRWNTVAGKIATLLDDAGISA